MIYDNNNGGEYGKFFVQSLQYPDGMATPEFQKLYQKFAKRILWMDGDVCPGAFQMNTGWWYKSNRERTLANPNIQTAKPHFHEYKEILGFYGTNPEDPWDLGGEVEFWVDGEQHILTRSTMVFLPPNIPHCPLIVNRVDTPIFHFSVVMNDVYTYEGNGSFRAE